MGRRGVCPRAVVTQMSHRQKEYDMIEVREGQCGLCKHFGEHHESASTLVQIRTTHEAPEELVDECGHPKMENFHLKVTPIASCDGYEPAVAA